MSPIDIVAGGSLLLALPLALLAGLIAFASPCVLPLVPGYLAYVTGITNTGEVNRRRMLTGAALFVLGFSIVFLGFFVLIGSVGVIFAMYEETLLRIAGGLVIVMGLASSVKLHSYSAHSGPRGGQRPAWLGHRCSVPYSRSAGRRVWALCSQLCQRSRWAKAPQGQH